MSRRGVLGTFAALVGASACTQALGTQPPTTSTPVSSFEALGRYCGVYVKPLGGMVGIDRFINDAGVGVLLFADFSTGIVRSLFERGEEHYTMGAGFADPDTVELDLGFTRSADGKIASIVLGSGDGTAQRAVKLDTREEAVTFTQGDARLSGTLILPPGPGPHPAITLLHGSGHLTRYSFGPYPRFFNSLGLAVLIYDKRATGQSTGRLIDASTGRPETLWDAWYPDDIRADALAALSHLKSHSGIDPGKIGFWGSSEGGMLTTQVAAHSSDPAFIINSVGFMGGLSETILYQGAARLRSAGKSEEEIVQAVEFNSFWMDVGRTGQGWDEFVRRRESIIAAGKRGWLFYEEAGFTSLEQLQWTMAHILDFDSLPDVSKVTCPALGIFGAGDVLTDSEVAARRMLEALEVGGNPDATTLVVPNASHSLMEMPSGNRMAPGVFDTLHDWIGARICAPDRRYVDLWRKGGPRTRCGDLRADGARPHDRQR